MNLRDDKRQNIQGELDFSSAWKGEARKTGRKETESSQAAHEHESPASTNRLMEEICEWKNLKEAMRRVKANKGSASNSASGMVNCAALSKCRIKAGLKGHLDWVQGHSSHDV
jgi:hypothetical protein